MSYNVCVKKKSGEDGYFSVPEEVFVYIQGLEFCIKKPNESKLFETYPYLKPDGESQPEEEGEDDAR